MKPGSTFLGCGADEDRSLIAILTRLGLTGNLLLCLDAGAAQSYPGSGQTWFDLSGQGNDFHRGSSGAAEGNDPTFNGVAGSQSASEYWSFDGGDNFQIVSSPAAFDAFHKDGAVFTILHWMNPASGESGGLFCNTNHNVSETGIRYSMDQAGSGRPGIAIQAASVAKINKNADTGMVSGAWNMIALSYNENGGGSACFFYLNGAYNSATGAGQWSGSLTSPSTGPAGYAETIGARTGNSGPNTFLLNGSKLAMVAVWATALSKADIDLIWAETRLRYGV